MEIYSKINIGDISCLIANFVVKKLEHYPLNVAIVGVIFVVNTDYQKIMTVVLMLIIVKSELRRNNEKGKNIVEIET